MSFPNKPPEPGAVPPELEAAVTEMLMMMCCYNPKRMGYVLFGFDREVPGKEMVCTNVEPEEGARVIRNFMNSVANKGGLGRQ